MIQKVIEIKQRKSFDQIYLKEVKEEDFVLLVVKDTFKRTIHILRKLTIQQNQKVILCI